MIALGALVACGSATAQPDPAVPVTPPAGWQRLPAAATAAKTAAGAPGITIEQVDAWGEPTTGCYALWFALRGGSGGADALAKEIVDFAKSESRQFQPPAEPSGSDWVLILDEAAKNYPAPGKKSK